MVVSKPPQNFLSGDGALYLGLRRVPEGVASGPRGVGVGFRG